MKKWSLLILALGVLAWWLWRSSSVQVPVPLTKPIPIPARAEHIEARTRAVETPPLAEDLSQGWSIAGRALRCEGPADDATAISGATIRLRRIPSDAIRSAILPSREVSTAFDGRFEITGIVGDDEARIEIDAPPSAIRAFGFHPDRMSPPPHRLELGDIVLEPSALFAVDVRGKEGEPITNAEVSLFRVEARHPIYSDPNGASGRAVLGESRGDGTYLFPRAGLGQHGLRVTAPGHTAAWQRVDLPSAQTLRIDLAIGRKIAGRVLSAEGSPIAKAKVQAHWEPERETDPEGRFAFDTLTKDTYSIDASADGFAWRSLEEVPSGTEDLEIVLVREAGVEGEVTSDDDEKPVAECRVLLRHSGGGEVDDGTNASGKFALRGLCEGTWNLWIDHESFEPSEPLEIELKPEEHVSGISINLHRGLAVRVVARDAETGELVPKASIVTRPKSRNDAVIQGIRTVVTASNGTALLRGLEPGKHWINAEAADFYAPVQHVEVLLTPETQEIPVDLRRGSSISGQVVGSDGVPIAEASVWADVVISRSASKSAMWDDGSRINTHPARADADGRFRISALSPQSGYILTALHRDHAAGTTEKIEVRTGKPVEGVTIVLTRGGTLRGRVTDVKGEPIGGASLAAHNRADSAANADDRFSTGTAQIARRALLPTDSGGSFETSRLPGGEYDVTATAAGYLARELERIQVRDGETTEVAFTLIKGEVLSGRVVDAEGAPIEGAEVTVYSDRDSNLKTDGDGRFHADGVRPGTVSGSVRAAGYEWTQFKTGALWGRGDRDDGQIGSSLWLRPRTARGRASRARCLGSSGGRQQARGSASLVGRKDWRIPGASRLWGLGNSGFRPRVSAGQVEILDRVCWRRA